MQQGVVPDAITCNALVSACEIGKQPEQALEVFQAPMQQGVVLDAGTYDAMLLKHRC